MFDLLVGKMLFHPLTLTHTCFLLDHHDLNSKDG